MLSYVPEPAPGSSSARGPTYLATQPPELQWSTLKHLRAPDLKNTRLVCKSLNEVVIGKRAVVRISEKSGLGENDLKIAITMLVEKKAVGLVRDEEDEPASTGASGAPAIPGGNAPAAVGPATAKAPSLASAVRPTPALMSFKSFRTSEKNSPFDSSTLRLELQ